jgi:hypothetical protein
LLPSGAQSIVFLADVSRLRANTFTALTEVVL